MHNFVRLIAFAIFATAGYGWWQSAQLHTSRNTTSYSAEEIQKSLAELFPDGDFDLEASRIEVTSDSVTSFGASSDLGEAELFNGVPEGINVPVLEEKSVDIPVETDGASQKEVPSNGIFDSYFNEEVSQSTSVQESRPDDKSAEEQINVDEPTNSIGEITFGQSEFDDEAIADSETELQSEERESEDSDTAVVFGESSDSPTEELAPEESPVQLSNRLDTQDESEKKIVPVAARKNAVVRWDQKYKTTAGRSFEVKALGTGAHHVLVLGSLYGTESEAALIMDRILHNLTKNIEQYPNSKFLLVRTGNPDGCSYRVAGNVRGVLLDRNFSRSGQVKQVGTAQTRAEVETLTLLKVMDEFKPARIIHVRTSHAQTGKIQFTSQDEAIAAFFRDFGKFTVDNTTRNEPETSLAGFVSRTMKSDVVTVSMPVSKNINSDWMTHRETLLAVLEKLQPPHHSPPGKGREVNLNDGPFAEGASNDSSDVVPFGESKVFDELDPTIEVPEVEFLPPPPQANRTEEALETAGVQELPSPPEKK